MLRGRAFALAADASQLAARLETPLGEHLVLVDDQGARELPTVGNFEVLGFVEPRR
jgi:hypothetical protein